MNYKLNVLRNKRQTAVDFSTSGLGDKRQENNLNAPKRNIAMQAAFNGQFDLKFS